MGLLPTPSPSLVLSSYCSYIVFFLRRTNLRAVSYSLYEAEVDQEEVYGKTI